MILSRYLFEGTKNEKDDYIIDNGGDGNAGKKL